MPTQKKPKTNIITKNNKPLDTFKTNVKINITGDVYINESEKIKFFFQNMSAKYCQLLRFFYLKNT